MYEGHATRFLISYGDVFIEVDVVDLPEVTIYMAHKIVLVTFVTGLRGLHTVRILSNLVLQGICQVVSLITGEPPLIRAEWCVENAV